MLLYNKCVSEISVSHDRSDENADVLRLEPNDSSNYLIQRSFDGEIVALERAFAPAIFAVLVGDLDEDPAGFDPVADDGFDLGHVGKCQSVRTDVG